MSLESYGGSPGPSYGAAPPANPVEGTLWVFPADATNGVLWLFRYRVGQTFPWELIGGGWLVNAISTTEAPASTSLWVDLTTVGPSITIPRGGEYDAEWGEYVQNASAVVNSGNSGIGRVGDAANTVCLPPPAYSSAALPALRIDPPPGSFLTSMTKGTIGRNAANGLLVANDVLRMKYYSAAIGASGVWHGNRWMRLRPVRVS